MYSGANRAVMEIRDVKAQLEERLRAALDTAEGEIDQMRNRSNQDPLNFPIKVNSRLANQLSISERGDGRPGSGMVEGWAVTWCNSPER